VHLAARLVEALMLLDLAAQELIVLSVGYDQGQSADFSFLGSDHGPATTFATIPIFHFIARKEEIVAG
jgi:hypothetical protein